MNAHRKLLVPAAALSLAVLATGGAFAEGNARNEAEDQADIQMMSNAKISLTGAIQAAETAKGGKAVNAAFEGHNGQPAYEVELIAADGKSVMVWIDGETGKLLQAPAGGQDDDNENDEDED